MWVLDLSGVGVATNLETQAPRHTLGRCRPGDGMYLDDTYALGWRFGFPDVHEAEGAGPSTHLVAGNAGEAACSARPSGRELSSAR